MLQQEAAAVLAAKQRIEKALQQQQQCGQPCNVASEALAVQPASAKAVAAAVVAPYTTPVLRVSPVRMQLLRQRAATQT